MRLVLGSRQAPTFSAAEPHGGSNWRPQQCTVGKQQQQQLKRTTQQLLYCQQRLELPHWTDDEAERHFPALRGAAVCARQARVGWLCQQPMPSIQHHDPSTLPVSHFGDLNGIADIADHCASVLSSPSIVLHQPCFDM